MRETNARAIERRKMVSVDGDGWDGSVGRGCAVVWHTKVRPDSRKHARANLAASPGNLREAIPVFYTAIGCYLYEYMYNVRA